jgi:ABC-type multidrug transport system ATPase subunit
VLLDGAPATAALMRQLARYVEQDDHLLGSLTARETLDFAARLALPGMRAPERRARVNALLGAFGLAAHASTLVGTPLRRGLSGGQKRRLGIAAQLITRPRVLFLDEPTSGLDFVASHEAVSYLRAVARREQVRVAR